MTQPTEPLQIGGRGFGISLHLSSQSPLSPAGLAAQQTAPQLGGIGETQATTQPLTQPLTNTMNIPIPLTAERVRAKQAEGVQLEIGMLAGKSHPGSLRSPQTNNPPSQSSGKHVIPGVSGRVFAPTPRGPQPVTGRLNVAMLRTGSESRQSRPSHSQEGSTGLQDHHLSSEVSGNPVAARVARTDHGTAADTAQNTREDRESVSGLQVEGKLPASRSVPSEVSQTMLTRDITESLQQPLSHSKDKVKNAGVNNTKLGSSPSRLNPPGFNFLEHSNNHPNSNYENKEIMAIQSLSTPAQIQVMTLIIPLCDNPLITCCM